MLISSCVVQVTLRNAGLSPFAPKGCQRSQILQSEKSGVSNSLNDSSEMGRNPSKCVGPKATVVVVVSV